MIVRIEYPQPGVWLDLWGGTSGSFSGLDRFSRIIDQRWQNGISGTLADIDRYQYGYDQDSNRLYKANVVGTPVVSGGLDEYYAYDHLNRLTQMKRGTLNSTKTGISGTPTVQQSWTLDPTGNWSGFVTQASGTTNLNQSRTSNPVNEITNVTESTGPTWVTPAYDAAGNTTTMPQVTDPTQSFTAVYDAWNRMVSVSDSSGTVASYSYDGRSRRAVKLTYTGGTLSETRHFYFTNAWQDIEERVGTSTSMDKQYAWGIRYIDELVCRDDATPERLYACQDANYNVTSITDASGNVQERYLYESYGNTSVLAANWTGTNDGYSWTPRFTGQHYEIDSQVYLCKSRHYHSALGIFTVRDPISYASGVNLYRYVYNTPINRVDAFGMQPTPSTQPTTQPSQYVNLAFAFDDTVFLGQQEVNEAFSKIPPNGPKVKPPNNYDQFINDATNSLQQALDCCCKQFKILCNTGIRVVVDPNRYKPGPKNNDWGQDRAQLSSDLNSIQRPDNSYTPVLFTNSQLPGGAIGEYTIGQVGPVLWDGATLPHELGHTMGLKYPDNPNPHDTAHSPLPTNLMYKDKLPNQTPDQSWCEAMRIGFRPLSRF